MITTSVCVEGKIEALYTVASPHIVWLCRWFLLPSNKEKARQLPITCAVLAQNISIIFRWLLLQQCVH